MSSKFYLMMLRDKDCNGKTYTFAYNMVSEKLDPLLNAKLQSKFEFKTIEEAEANAREIAKQLFIYDHTKRPKVLKDFRLYRWWILDAEKPVQVWCGCYHYGSDELDRGEFKTLAELYPNSCCYGLKDAIVKKGKIDFSKEKDPSNGAIAKRAKETNENIEREIREYRENPKSHVKAYIDLNLGDSDPKFALDTIPYSSKLIKNFHKDSLNLQSEYCFVYPTKGCYFSERSASIVGVDPKSRKKSWACSVSRCIYKKEADWKADYSEMYRSTTRVFGSKEEAILHASILGFQQPQVFEEFKLPDYANRLLAYLEGVGGLYVFPAEIYRLLVIDGYVKPIEKFMKKKVAKTKSV